MGETGNLRSWIPAELEELDSRRGSLGRKFSEVGSSQPARLEWGETSGTKPEAFLYHVMLAPPDFVRGDLLTSQHCELHAETRTQPQGELAHLLPLKQCSLSAEPSGPEVVFGMKDRRSAPLPGSSSRSGTMPGWTSESWPDPDVARQARRARRRVSSGLESGDGAVAVIRIPGGNDRSAPCVADVVLNSLVSSDLAVGFRRRRRQRLRGAVLHFARECSVSPGLPREWDGGRLRRGRDGWLMKSRAAQASFAPTTARHQTEGAAAVSYSTKRHSAGCAGLGDEMRFTYNGGRRLLGAASAGPPRQSTDGTLVHPWPGEGLGSHIYPGVARGAQRV